MSNIFKSFVDSYRVQDSIGIEQGYREMAPAWKINGQNKYLQAWVEQLDTLNENLYTHEHKSIGQIPLCVHIMQARVRIQ